MPTKLSGIHLICLGSRGGPLEDDVTSFLVRATTTEWRENSVIAVDAGCHLGSIARILEKYSDLSIKSRCSSMECTKNSPTLQQEYTPRTNPTNCSDYTSLNSASELTTLANPPNTSSGLAHLFLRPSHATNQLDSSPLSSLNDFYPHKSPTCTLSECPCDKCANDFPYPCTLGESGPFTGLALPYSSPQRNALYIWNNLTISYLLTHAHLDHISSLVINSAYPPKQKKTIFALPSTINALRKHIFNDIIWPNLSDENGGVGFFKFKCLPALGSNSGKLNDCLASHTSDLCSSYIDVCKDLDVMAIPVSHGHNVSICRSQEHSSSTENIAAGYRREFTGDSDNPNDVLGEDDVGKSMLHQRVKVLTNCENFGPLFPHSYKFGGLNRTCEDCVYTSTAFFIRAKSINWEILIFGDVEPDSLSKNPRNFIVWRNAARKIAAGNLGAIVIECSYDDSCEDDKLYGHLCPRHLMAELQVLRKYVVDAMNEQKKFANSSAIPDRNIKCDSNHVKLSRNRRYSAVEVNEKRKASQTPRALSCTDEKELLFTRRDYYTNKELQSLDKSGSGPLRGITILIIHVKENLDDEVRDTREVVLDQIKMHAQRLEECGVPLGCEFKMARWGASYYFDVETDVIKSSC